MSFNIGNTTFGFTMRVPSSDEAKIDDLISSHATWMSETHSLNPEEGKLHTLEYYVSKATELNDMMDPSKGSTGNIIYTVSEVHIDESTLENTWNLVRAGVGLANFLNCLKNTRHW